MPDSNLPIPYERRMELIPERVAYVARPGLGALPAGTATMLVFMSPQIASFAFLQWAIWWPYPSTPGTMRFAIGGTALMTFLLLLVVWLLLRRNLALAAGILRAPFMRITVTDRRILWQVPWNRAPLMEIAADRVLGGILGGVDRRGRGNAALLLFPGDPAGDIDGNIHFDRLPNAHRFVEALERMQ